MELGALICTPKNPLCRDCPVFSECTAYNTDTIPRYPYKSPAARVPRYQVSIGIIINEGDKSFYIQKRPSEGHLGGLWEFPGGKAEKGESPGQTLIRECREELGAEVQIIRELPLIRHAYSHFKIEITPFICSLKEPGTLQPQEAPFRWITFEQLEQYPFPAANHKLFPHLSAYLEGLELK